MQKSLVNLESSQSCDSLAGRTANLSGKDFENTIELRIQQKGYALWDKKGDKPEKWYAKQYNVCKNLIGKKLVADFVLDDKTIIECKWQSSAGSVDEKYLWTVTNLSHTERDCIIIIEGGGCRPEMYDFIKEVGNTYGNVKVCNLSEFFKMSI